MIDRNHVAVILELFGKGICQPGEPPNAHSQIQVLPFDIASRDVLPIRVSAQDASANTNALSGEVSRHPLMWRRV
jgi:hypothetical protein